jgi:hypothetical protein
MDLDTLLDTLPVGGSAAAQARRRQNARLIVDEFLRREHTPSIALAAIANAYVESTLDADAVNWQDISQSGKRGVSVGLFQLRDPGAGSGYSVEQRQDPVLNTQIIIREYERYGRKVREAYDKGATLAELAGLFGQYVERGSGIEKRRAVAKQLFGPLADRRARDLDAQVKRRFVPSTAAEQQQDETLPSAPRAGRTLWVAGASTVVLVGLFGLLRWRAYRQRVKVLPIVWK